METIVETGRLPFWRIGTGFLRLAPTAYLSVYILSNLDRGEDEIHYGNRRLEKTVKQTYYKRVRFFRMHD